MKCFSVYSVLKASIVFVSICTIMIIEGYSDISW